MNTTTNHGAVIPLLPTEKVNHMTGFIAQTCADERLRVAEESLRRCSESHAELSARMRKRVEGLETELLASEVRVASYQYHMRKLAGHNPLPEDKAEWPALLPTMVAEAKEELAEFRHAMEQQLGEQQVHEALTSYQTNEYGHYLLTGV